MYTRVYCINMEKMEIYDNLCNFINQFKFDIVETSNKNKIIENLQKVASTLLVQESTLITLNENLNTNQVKLKKYEDENKEIKNKINVLVKDFYKYTNLLMNCTYKITKYKKYTQLEILFCNLYSIIDEMKKIVKEN